MTQERPPAGGAAANGSPEVPHPAIGVRDLRSERLELAAGLTGPGSDGIARRAAIVELVVGRLRRAVGAGDRRRGRLGHRARGRRQRRARRREPGQRPRPAARARGPRPLDRGALGARAEALVPHLGRGPRPGPLGPVARAVPPGRVQGPPGGRRAARPAAGLGRRRRHRPRQVRAAGGLARRPRAGACPSCWPPPGSAPSGTASWPTSSSRSSRSRAAASATPWCSARSPPPGSPTARTARSTWPTPTCSTCATRSRW